jgi:hypothetical protein
VRVLQLIGDTDADLPQLAAVALHRALASSGLEVRTLALAPGRAGGLEQDVPAMAPSRRSFAARGMVTGESRWSDVVVLHAPRALTSATAPSRRGGSVPVVVAHWQVPSGRSGAAVARIHAAAHVVVASSASVAASVRDQCHDQLREQLHDPGDVVVVDGDLSDAGRPVVDGIEWARILTGVARSDEAS